MEVKKILIAVSAILMLTGFTAHAADDTVIENMNAETVGTVEEIKWGSELFTKLVVDTDIVFGSEGAGITMINSDGTKDGTSIRAVYRGDKLTLAADGGTGGYYIYYNEVDPAKKYHLNITGRWGVSNGIVDMIIYTYKDDGTMEETKKAYMVLMNQMFASSGVGPAGIRVEKNTSVENLTVKSLMPDSIRLVSPPKTVAPGSSLTVSARPYRQGEVLDYDIPVSYTVQGEGASITGDGVLTVSPDAPEGTVKVTAAVSGGTWGELNDTAEIEVTSGDVFSINSAVMSADGKKLESVKAVKNYYLNGSAAFVITVYDENGRLSGGFVKYVPAKTIPAGKETEINLGYTLPEDFDPGTWQTDVNVWSASGKCALPEAMGETAVRAYFETNGGAVEWLGSRGTVAGMINGKTVILQPGNSRVYIDSEPYELPSAPYIRDDLTYAPAELFTAIQSKS